MDSRFRSDELRSRTTVDLLLDGAPDDDVLGVVAAGALEDFVKDADVERLRWIEQRAEQSACFRGALRRVWAGTLSAEALARVERAARTPLPRRDEDVVIEVVAGDLPGTVQIRGNGMTLREIKCEPDRVETMIDLVKGHLPEHHRTTPGG